MAPLLICSGKGLSSGMLPLGSMIADLDMNKAFRGEETNFFGPDRAGIAPPMIATNAEIDDLCGRIEQSMKDEPELYAKMK